MNYRREIDGLRAIAIIPVIFFHLGTKLFSGGFVGVDIFFVISGYLITSIILAEIEIGDFQLISFYERRARRILPPLFVIMVVSLPFAWFFLPQRNMKLFSETLVAVPTFMSNILFWKTSGYFETPTELNPLLHTWSLAVEEQYYLLFPLFLITTWKFGKQKILITLFILACVSLFISQWASSTAPSFSFYMLPTRGWELLIGVFLAFYLQRKNRLENHLFSQLFSLIGFSLLLISFLFFSEKTPFPGFYAMVPTIGAALVILYANSQTVIGKLLGRRELVALGLLSYSAYLWHQPLLAFSRFIGFDTSSNYVLVILFIIIFVLSFFTWRYVERPFREKQKFSRKNIFSYAIFFSFLFIVMGIFGYFKNGDIGQLNKNQKEFISYFSNEGLGGRYSMKNNIPKKFRQECNFYDVESENIGKVTQIPRKSISLDCYQADIKKEKAIFIWGDSHAQQLYWGVKNILPKEWNIFQVASSGCPAKLNALENKKDYCEYSNWFAMKNINELKPNVVLIAQNIGHNIEMMLNISTYLMNAGVKKVIFTGPTPHWQIDLPIIIAKRMPSSVPKRTFSGLDNRIVKLDKELQENFPSSKSVKYVSIINYLCDADGCIVYYGSNIKEGLTSVDYGHLTPITSYNFAKDVLSKELLN